MVECIWTGTPSYGGVTSCAQLCLCGIYYKPQYVLINKVLELICYLRNNPIRNIFTATFHFGNYLFCFFFPFRRKSRKALLLRAKSQLSFSLKD